MKDKHPIQVVAETFLVASCYKTGISAGLMGRLAHIQTLLQPLSCHLPLFQNVCWCQVFHMKKKKKKLAFYANEYTGDIYFNTDSFAQRLVLPQGKSRLGIGLFIHELLKEPLINNSLNAVML